VKPAQVTSKKYKGRSTISIFWIEIEESAIGPKLYLFFYKKGKSPKLVSYTLGRKILLKKSVRSK